jgi:hypothetical protein
MRPAWMRPSATRSQQTVITPVALHADRLGPRPRWRSGGAGALEPEHLVGRERVRPHAQQLARVWVQEHQRLRLDADDHRAPAKDLGGEHLTTAQADQAAVVDRAVDFDRGARFGGRQRRRPGRHRVVAGELREIGDAQVRTQALDPGAGDREMETSTPAQKRTVWPARPEPSQNCA